MNKQKYVFALVIVVLVAAGLYTFVRPPQKVPDKNLGQIGNNETVTKPQEAVKSTTECKRNYDPKSLEGKTVEYKNKIVALKIKGYGEIKIAPSSETPKTSENFVRLAGSGFYNCLTFHRLSNLTGSSVNPARIIQGGDPEGTGMGGPGYTVPAEIKLKHKKGAVAMARTGDAVNPARASSGSQFYIAVDALPFLDDQYTVFGEVVSGLDVAEKISQAQVQGGGTDGPPVQPIVIESVRVESK